MLKYKIDILKELKIAGYTTTRLRKEKLLSESTIQTIREQKAVGGIALDRICSLLNVQPGDLIEYIPESAKVE